MWRVTCLTRRQSLPPPAAATVARQLRRTRAGLRPYAVPVFAIDPVQAQEGLDSNKRDDAARSAAKKSRGKRRSDPFQGRKRSNKWAGGRQRVPLSDLEVGQKLDGRVRAVLNNAVIIKSRTETDAYLPEHAMGEFGPPSSFRVGMQVTCHISHVMPEKEVLRVTMLKGGRLVAPMKRKAVMEKLSPGDIVSGKIKKIVQEANSDGWVRTTGIFVDIGAQRNAYFPSDGQGIPPVGEVVSVQILPDGLDEEQLRIRRRIGAKFVCSGAAPDDAATSADSVAAAISGLSIGAATAATPQPGIGANQGVAAYVGEDLEYEEVDESSDDLDDDYERYAYLDDY